MACRTIGGRPRDERSERRLFKVTQFTYDGHPHDNLIDHLIHRRAQLGGGKVTENELLRTPRFYVERVRRQLLDGSVKQREVIRHVGSVVIVPYVTDDRICLIKNFRVAVNQQLVELPAGTLEIGEPPAKCAHRELSEETGFSAGHLQHLTSFFAAPGILDEEMHLFVATNLTAGLPQREPGEEIENLILTRQEALEMIRSGEIRDAKTIVGLLYTQQWRPNTSTPTSRG